MQQNMGHYFGCSDLILKMASMVDKTLAEAPTGEEAIPTILEDNTITTEDSSIAICASMFSHRYK